MILGPTFLASWVATVLGIYFLSFCNAMNHYFGNKSTDNADDDLFGPLWTLIILSIICEIGAYFGHTYNKYFLIIGFAFVSAYLIIRGISFSLGGFMSET